MDRDLLGSAADPTGNGFHGWPAYKRSKAAAIRAVDSLGVFDLIRHRRRHDLLVVAYHDVLPGPLDLSDPMLGMAVDTETLRAHMRELRDHHVPVSLSQVVGWLHDDASLPAGAVLVTFDDGHRNVRQHALPILEELGIPAVVFVTAAFLGERSRMTWYEELYVAVIHSPVSALRHRGRLIPLGDRLARARLCGRLIDRARELAPRELDSLLTEILEQLGSGRAPDVPDERLAWLTTEDCVELIDRRVAVGAHSLSHPILKALDDVSAMREIEGSRKSLEAQLGRTVVGFAYPFGEPGIDFGEREQSMAHAAGFRAAFAASGGLVRRGADPWCLPRIGIGQFSMPAFRFATSGAHHMFRRHWRALRSVGTRVL